MNPLTTYIILAIGAVGLYFMLPGAPHARRFRIGGIVLLLASLAGLLNLFARQTAGTWLGGNVFFYLFSAITLVAAVKVVTHSRPVYAVLYFVLVILSSAGLVLLLAAQFLAIGLVIVYAGAIMVTYVFMIMLATQGGREECDTQSKEPLAAVLLGFVLCSTITGVGMRASWADPRSLPDVAGDPTGRIEQARAAMTAGRGHVAEIGITLFADHAVALQVAGLLLLVSMVGAVVIATKHSAAATTSEPAGAGQAATEGKRG